MNSTDIGLSLLLRRAAEVSVSRAELLDQQSELLERRRMLRRTNLELMRDIVTAGRQFCDLVSERLVRAELTALSAQPDSPDASSREPI